METCPHCEERLELTVDAAEISVYREDDAQTIEPDVFNCRSCGAVLFATVSSELADG